jgi:hypothetical protein
MPRESTTPAAGPASAAASGPFPQIPESTATGYAENPPAFSLGPCVLFYAGQINEASGRGNDRLFKKLKSLLN